VSKNECVKNTKWNQMESEGELTFLNTNNGCMRVE